MAVFIPFQGFRYRADNRTLQNLVCPPYDIISPAERAVLTAKDADNIVSVELPAGGEDRYEKAAAHLAKMIASARLLPDRVASFYVCRMRFQDREEEKSVAGIVGRLRLESLDSGVVRPHENTLLKAKDDRLRLMKATAANISSVYALFSDPDAEIRRIMEETLQKSPAASVCLDGVSHSLFPVSGRHARRITDLFRDKELFIADGHHRYETGLNYKAYRESLGETVDDGHPASYIMTTCVPLEHPGLVIYPTHRIIRGIRGFSSEKLKEQMARDFLIRPAADRASAERLLQDCYTAGITAFLYYDGGFYLLLLKPETDLAAHMPGQGAACRALDVSVLHSVILRRHLDIGMENMAAGENLLYTRDVGEAAAAVDSGEADCAFLINPTRVSEMAAVAADGERMPQKSTYFYPKLITGLVINKM